MSFSHSFILLCVFLPLLCVLVLFLFEILLTRCSFCHELVLLFVVRLCLSYGAFLKRLTLISMGISVSLFRTSRKTAITYVSSRFHVSNVLGSGCQARTVCCCFLIICFFISIVAKYICLTLFLQSGHKCHIFVFSFYQTEKEYGVLHNDTIFFKEHQQSGVLSDVVVVNVRWNRVTCWR